jgi:hypothetical protein
MGSEGRQVSIWTWSASATSGSYCAFFTFYMNILARPVANFSLESLYLIWYVEDFAAGFGVDGLGSHVIIYRCVGVDYCILTLEGFPTRRLECHVDPKRIILRHSVDSLRSICSQIKKLRGRGSARDFVSVVFSCSCQPKPDQYLFLSIRGAVLPTSSARLRIVVPSFIEMSSTLS